MDNKNIKKIYTERDDLFAQMRKCGHYLFHKKGRRSTQDRILHILAENDEISQKQLQEVLGIKSGSLSEILSKLELKQHIVKYKDNQDKRKVIIKITELGKVEVNSQLDIESELNFFSKLDESQKNELNHLLSILVDDWYGESE